MSMRIQNDVIATTPASQAAAAESSLPAGSSKRLGSTADAGADQIEISSLSGNVAQSSAVLASRQAARVSQLAALYAKGQYQVDSQQLSRAMVSHAISAGSLEEGN
ncbi:exported hypothetical protein [Candidatus Sulfopaludibacter sp. SbA3]|nr:exported hypothetical protein [Candidatus Sulfopaludibacter sp. SbA3]